MKNNVHSTGFLLVVVLVVVTFFLRIRTVPTPPVLSRNAVYYSIKWLKQETYFSSQFKNVIRFCQTNLGTSSMLAEFPKTGVIISR